MTTDYYHRDNFCVNCGVPQSDKTCGHNVSSSVWYCSMRCFNPPTSKAPLMLIRGLPGSGKSTLARSYSFHQRWPIHLEADMFHMKKGKYVYVPALAAEAHLWCVNTTRIMLNNGHRVVVSNTFVTLDEIAPYLNLGFDLDIVVMKGSFGSTHNVPDEVIDHMRKRWQELP